MTDPEKTLRQMFAPALAAAEPARCVPPNLPTHPNLSTQQNFSTHTGRTLVLGAGKAAAPMARAVEENWQGPIEGLVVTPYGHAVGCDHVEVVEAAHPVPDEAGRDAARRILDLATGARAGDLVLCLISGGGSALLSLPAPGLSLGDKQLVNAALLRSGASISEMNCVRKHLSAIKGGRLAAAASPARVVTLAISDVPGDDPGVIASGPTVPDPTTFAQAAEILRRYRIDVPMPVHDHLEHGREETPKPGDPRLADAEAIVIATPMRSLRAAAEVARQAGFTPLILGDAIEGEASVVGKIHAGIALAVVKHGQPAAAPMAVLSGGETTVTMRGSGKGGRNTEFLLGFVAGLGGTPAPVWALAADTDGIDGSESNAGAIVRPDTAERAAGLDLRAADHLYDNDSHGFFAALGDLIEIGPTRTNVNDFRAVLVLGGD